jgi:dihydropteroate synthase
MGVLNATPDSFSDGGRLPTAEAAVEQGLRLLEEGADWLDVGGESTRPGATPVRPEEEIRRVVPVIRGLRRRTAAPISVDTTRRDVARAALDAGADIVNDVSALRFDPALGELVAERGVPVVLMHARGDFEGRHKDPSYADVPSEVGGELGEALKRAEQAGVRREATILDPGLGFSKNARHSLEALAGLDALLGLDRPVLVGPSRKSFIGTVLDKPVDERVFGTAAAVATAVLLGAHLVRVHDVREMVDVVRVCDAVLSAGERSR